MIAEPPPPGDDPERRCRARPDDPERRLPSPIESLPPLVPRCRQMADSE